MPILNAEQEIPQGSFSRSSLQPARESLSVAIITLNEEHNLARTLASVRFADEVVVVDSGSTDRTVEIARAAGARVISQPWLGFAAQKNFAIEQCSGGWILSLDADEELSVPLQQEIAGMLENPPLQAQAFMIKRRNYFLGRWMRFGGYYPDPKLRLFRRQGATGAPLARFADRPVHETVAFDGPCAHLHHDILHHAYPTIDTYIEHMNRYSSLGAQVAAAKGRVSRSWWAFQYRVVVVPLFTFLWNYCFRLGFLDGREGFLLHAFHSFYTCWKYAKAWHMARSSGTPES